MRRCRDLARDAVVDKAFDGARDGVVHTVLDGARDGNGGLGVTLDREGLLAAFRAAVAACDPALRVRDGLRDTPIAELIAGRRRFGVAVGKAAIAMARGAGAVERGVIVVPARAEDERPSGGGGTAVDVAGMPAGWRVIESAHPFVDERSVIAARAAREIVDAAGEGDVVIALISGGASALIEEPIDGVTLEELGASTRAVMESGAPIATLNLARAALSRVKRGKLVATCAAPIATLAVSDVIGDELSVIGSGPTIGPWFAAPRGPATRGPAARGPAARGPAARANDRAIVVAPMSSFGEAALGALGPRARVDYVHEPLAGEVAACATQLVERAGVRDATAHGTCVAWGEPTLRVPADHGEGGRAQQLALELARALRGTTRIAMVIGSDGVDGPPPKSRPAPAGAIVDGGTWDAIIAAGHDPERALARCDAGTVLEAVGALVVTGSTGINHGDLVVIGDARAAEFARGVL